MMTPELARASKDEAPVLGRLLELYSHELSAVANLRIGDDGLYGYRYLPRYWIEPERHPYLLRIAGELAGFALLRQGSDLTGDPDVWDMAEFFVLRRHRRHRIGERAAHTLWTRHPGRWEVRVMPGNDAALAFWQRAVDAFVGNNRVEPDRVDVAGRGWRHVFRFSAPGPSQVD